MNPLGRAGAPDEPSGALHCPECPHGRWDAFLADEAAEPVVTLSDGSQIPLRLYEGFVKAEGDRIVPLEVTAHFTVHTDGSVTRNAEMAQSNKISFERPGWDDWALGIAAAVAARADCTRRQVGAVILDSDHRIVATGYNGAPSGAPGCGTSGACPRGRLSYAEAPRDVGYTDPANPCVALHAEENAVLHARGPLLGCTIYVTDSPCPNCQRFLAGTGIVRAVWPGGSIDFGVERSR